jgi:excisionase family DNA binding protein
MAGSVLRRAAPKPERRLVYTPEEVADILSVTAPTVKDWMTRGLIRYVLLPKGRRIPVSALDEFLDERTIEPS